MLELGSDIDQLTHSKKWKAVRNEVHPGVSLVPVRMGHGKTCIILTFK